MEGRKNACPQNTDRKVGVLKYFDGNKNVVSSPVSGVLSSLGSKMKCFTALSSAAQPLILYLQFHDLVNRYLCA